jgi:cold shock CspA family protein
MNLAFGVVDVYLSDKGFGFVEDKLSHGNLERQFFHIKSVKKSRPDLVAPLESGDEPWFWYTLEESPKGKQAIPLNQQQLNSLRDHAHHFVAAIEQYWLRQQAPPSWLDEVSNGLLGEERTMELAEERALAQAERERIAGEQLKEWEAKHAQRLAKEEAELAQRKAEKAAERAMENAEFDALVAEMASCGFTESAAVSHYIVRNKLGYKYKKISGYLLMEREGHSWEFKGGFPPDIYARLCEALGLGNRGTKSKVTRFESFEEHKERKGFY